MVFIRIYKSVGLFIKKKKKKSNRSYFGAYLYLLIVNAGGQGIQFILLGAISFLCNFCNRIL